MNIFIRSFLVNQTTNVSGELFGGTVGFLQSLKLYIRELKPSKVIIVWEQGGGSSRRKSIFSEYKANRIKSKDLKENLSEREVILTDTENKTKQLLVLTQMLSCLPVCQVYITETEGDDVTAYIAKYKFTDQEKIIVSTDKDFYQLLENPNIKIYSPNKKILIDYRNINEEFGISARNFALARSIVGDESDNINGIYGIGLKTIAKRFPELNNNDKDYLISDLENLCRKNLTESKKTVKCFQDILENIEIVKRNWKLMYLQSSNLSANQIDKINERIDTFKTNMNHMAFIKLFGTNHLQVSNSVNEIITETKYLLSINF
jgi:DNA polymerase-1